MRIMISNISSFPVNCDSVKKIAEIVLLKEECDNATLSVVFINKKEIIKINKKYRKKNEATDVLSFPQNGFGLKGTDINFIGETFICPSIIKEQANNLAGVLYGEEFSRVIIHGILHLLGYDHEGSKKEEKRMTAKEELYFSLVSKVDLFF